MINNFEQIKGLLKFETDDDFYHLMVLKRRKENPTLPTDSILLKTYFVSSIEYLELKKEEIIALCNLHNARACINLNKRSFEQVALEANIEIGRLLAKKDYRGVRKAYESVCGSENSGKHIKWLLDIDTKDMNVVNKVIDYVIEQNPKGDKDSALIETKNGYHLIVKKFDNRYFNNEFPDIKIQKDNPTILYVS